MNSSEEKQQQFEKYEENNQVAVLYSSGFGAGWYTWHRGNKALLFDKKLIKFVMKDDIAGLKQYIEQNKEKYGDPYLGGAKNLRVKWVPKGEKFEVEEYDGRESIHIIGHKNYITA